MSQRETQAPDVQESWKGVDQRTQPTLVANSYFVMARGVYFGLEDAAERLPGKALIRKITGALLHVADFGDNVLLQGEDSVSMIPLSELDTNFNFVPFTWVSNGDANGIFYYIGQNYGAAAWVNPVSVRVVGSTSSAIVGFAAQTTERTPLQFISNNIVNSWLKFDFGAAYSVVVTDYSLRGREDFAGDLNPRTWRLQGSNDDALWSNIDIRVNDTTLTGGGVWGHFIVGSLGGAFRYLRIYQDGLNAVSTNHLALSEVEFYGQLKS